jgi:ketosteroid isomerase-like protein
MKMAILAALSLLSMCSFVVANNVTPVAATAETAEFQTFLREFEQATEQFINGDATRWKQHISQREDATILGGFGGYERGPAVRSRYDWAAAQFQPSGADLKVERLSSVVSGELAYTVTIERSRALIAGQTVASPMSLRVTHAFRKEDGVWKLVHRHADHLVEKAAPAAVVRQQ